MKDAPKNRCPCKPLAIWIPHESKPDTWVCLECGRLTASNETVPDAKAQD